MQNKQILKRHFKVVLELLYKMYQRQYFKGPLIEVLHFINHYNFCYYYLLMKIEDFGWLTPQIVERKL